MRSRPFPGDDTGSSLRISQLGFGCSAIAGRVSRKDSLRALDAAFDAGITLYDTARSYGYGQSEGVVGDFLHGRRHSVVLCTKFGILPAAANGWKQRLKPLAQMAVRAFPALRAVAQRQVHDQFVANQFTPGVLQTSLETSLQALKTDYVDMLLMHAAPVSVLRQEDLLEAMGRLVESGKVRMAGISGEIPVIERYFAERPAPLATAQFALNLSNIAFAAETVQNDDALLVGNHVFGGPGGAAQTKATIAALHASADLSPELREKLDVNDPQVLPEVVLNCVLRGTGLAAVVPAMMQVRHIQSNVRALETCRFTDGELAWLRQSFATSGNSRQAGLPAEASAP